MPARAARLMFRVAPVTARRAGGAEWRAWVWAWAVAWLGVFAVGGLPGAVRALEFAPPGVMACVLPCDDTAARCLTAGYGAFCQPKYRLCVERCDPSLQFFETFSRVHPEAATRLNPAVNQLTRSEIQRSLCAQSCDMNAITCAASNAVNTPICRNGRLACMARCSAGEDSGAPPMRLHSLLPPTSLVPAPPLLAPRLRVTAAAPRR